MATTEAMMAQTRICPNCGAAIPEDFPHGFCPGCLLAAGVDARTVVSDGREPRAAIF